MQKKILIVGQTPPPFHGQAAMILTLLEGEYKNVQLYHVRMSFSKEINDIGKLQIKKLFHLVGIICKIWYYRIIKGVNILYYPPSTLRKPIYRDMAVLICTRWLFKKIIFHSHAGGISRLLEKFNLVEKTIFQLSFWKADIAITPSTFLLPDIAALKAKQSKVVPYGIEDHYSESLKEPNNSRHVNILFVGSLRETKGEMVLLEACYMLNEDNIDFTVNIAGKFHSDAAEKLFFDKMTAYGLKEKVFYKGLIRGVEKDRMFANADIFCFPTYYESEAFPLVLIEAMQFKLPVVSTKWRGVPDMVEDGINGFLVDVKDAKPVYTRLKELINNEALRIQLGEEGRKAYLQKFTIDMFYANIDSCFRQL